MKEQPDIIRPWGTYTTLHRTRTYWVKQLVVKKGHRTSLQSHEGRDEVWYILSGSIIVQIGEKQHHAKKGDAFFIPKKEKHRLTGIKKSCVLELAFGKVMERDITRHEDDYGRA